MQHAGLRGMMLALSHDPGRVASFVFDCCGQLASSGSLRSHILAHKMKLDPLQSCLSPLLRLSTEAFPETFEYSASKRLWGTVEAAGSPKTQKADSDIEALDLTDVDPVALMTNIWDLHDRMMELVIEDSTLQAAACRDQKQILRQTLVAQCGKGSCAICCIRKPTAKTRAKLHETWYVVGACWFCNMQIRNKPKGVCDARRTVSKSLSMRFHTELQIIFDRRPLDAPSSLKQIVHRRAILAKKALPKLPGKGVRNSKKPQMTNKCLAGQLHRTFSRLCCGPESRAEEWLQIVSAYQQCLECLAFM